MKKKISIFLGILFLLLAGTVDAFQETFDDPSVLNDTWICEPSDLDWSISGGKLRATDIDSDLGACYYSGGVAWTDYEIVVPEISLNLGWETVAGVVFRYQNSNNYYLATVNAESWMLGVYITLEKVVGGSWSAIEGSYFGEFNDLPASVEFKVVVDGESIKVYIDGELKIDTTDADLSNGTVGAWVNAEFDAMDASWDEFQVTFTSPVCGNNILEPPEVCDDNNTSDCDGCAGDCTRLDNACGDGILECGEECDDWNLIDGDGCSSGCVIELPGPICGNGALEPPEVCDDNNTVDCDGCAGDCTRVDNVCGDGILECGEECDDLNLIDGDGCSSACEIELPGPGPTCDGYNVWGWAWSENIGWISFSCSGGISSHWQEVDDVASDDLGTYVWTDSSGEQKDAYELEDPSVAGAINQIRVKMRYQGTIKNYFRLNGVESAFPGSGSVFGAWGERTTSWAPSRPGGGAWTWNDIRDLQVVVGLSTFTFAGTTYQGRLTQIYIEVDYAGGTLVLRPDDDGDYVNIDNPPAGSPVDYGVNINPATGIFSGYAWSENIGWISFEPADLVDCPPSGTCNASVDLSTGAVSGWARALVAEDGWDGWIGLSGTWADGVSITSVPAPSEFEGWAWGDDVVGWISFNCSNRDSCAAVDYKVMTSIIIVIDDSPYIEPGSTNIQYEEYCDFSPTSRIGFEWTYQDDEGDQQAQYNLQIATDAGFSNLVVDVIVNQSVLPGSNGSSAISVLQSPTAQIDDLDIAYGGTYFWRASVKAVTGNLNWSNWESGSSFSTPSNPYPNPSFTWYPLNPPAEVEVTFTDNSTCYTGVANCKDDADTSYEWDFDKDFVIDDVVKGDAVYTYLATGDYTIRLGVTDIIDGIPRTCYQEEDLTATLPLPTWKEITPF